MIKCLPLYQTQLKIRRLLTIESGWNLKKKKKKLARKVIFDHFFNHFWNPKKKNHSR